MIVFLDCEASSLAPRISYPTEIGWVAHDFSAGYVALVKPESDWIDWNSEAEAVTGLSRQTIERFGEPSEKVAEALDDMLAGADVLTDSPGHDGRWLLRLYQAAHREPTFPILDDVSAQPGAAASLDADRLIVRALDESADRRRPRNQTSVAERHETLVAKAIAAVGLKAHRALDDAMALAISLALAEATILDEPETQRAIETVVEKAKATKRKIIDGAVARWKRSGGEEEETLRKKLER
jgi:hypothetical protein